MKNESKIRLSKERVDLESSAFVTWSAINKRYADLRTSKKLKK